MASAYEVGLTAPLPQGDIVTSTRSAATVRLSALMGAVVLALSGCGAAKEAVSSATSSAKATASASSNGASNTSSAASGSASSSAQSNSGDAPIASDGFDMPSDSAKSYPPEQVSGPGAIDCYSGGSRIYDRSGITCADAIAVKQAYEATPGAKSGKAANVKGYECSHNPTTMVNQGAAPAKCTDGHGNVVFDWRYPGAPKPIDS